MPVAPVTIGMVGLTHPHTNMHLRTLDTSALVKGVALCDPDAGARARMASAWRKADGTYADLDALLARPDVPAVLITLPTDQTPDAIVRAARAGKHVLCEKPCGRSAAELRPVLDELERAGVGFLVFYTWRGMPPMLKMRELVQAGALGRLSSVEVRVVTSNVARRDPSHWLFKRSVAGGGIMSWLGCHRLDLLRFITGQEVADVSALVGTLSGEPIDVEDVASVALRLTGGALVSFHAGYLLDRGAPGYEGASGDGALILRGTKGTLSYDTVGDEHVVTLESSAPGWHTAPRQVFRYTLPSVAAYGGAPGLQFVEDFLQGALAGERASVASALDALRVVEMLDAIDESAETERVVHLRR